MKSCRTFIPFILLLCSFSLKAQFKISGTIHKADNAPADGANILLQRSKDSALVKGVITPSNGNFSFDNIRPGAYFLHTSFAGHKDFISEPIVVSDKDVNAGQINLARDEKELSAVTVVAKKPLFEQKIDRMVVNVKNSITSAGSSVLEVLEKSPGVLVNKQNNSIGMNGKDGVVVMINGKISRIPADALVQMLAGMNASNVEKIELINTPPANFDAEGNAGFINIVLISNTNKGWNGSYTLSAGYGLGYTPNGSVNFNYRNDKINIFGDYSIKWTNQLQTASNFRRTLVQSVITENASFADRHPEEATHDARLGLDIQLSPKTVLGFLAGTYDRRWVMNSYNDLYITKNGIPDTTVKVLNHELNHWRHLMGNVNFSHKIREGESISADIDYLYYTDNNPNSYINNYYNASGTAIGEEQTRSTKKTPIRIWVGKFDYTVKLAKNIDAEAGAKFTISRFNNNVSVAALQTGGWFYDPDLTADYNLKENIGAAYAAFNIKASEKTSFKLGLRYEHTQSNLGSDKQKNIVDRSYGNFFPSIFMSQKLDENNSINIAYSRRVTRPTFTDMAPFLIFIDPYTYFSGNSGLQPAFSNSFKLDYLLKKMVFSVSYSKEESPIAQFQPKVNTKNNTQYFTSENLDNIKTVNVGLSIPVTVTNWWTMQNNFQFNWQQLNAVYLNGPYQIIRNFYTINSSQTFSLPKRFTLEMTLFYISKSLFGASVWNPISQLDIGLQKKFRDNKSTLRVAVNDVFWGNIWKGVSDIPSENIYVESRWNLFPRKVQVTFSYNFGKKNVQGKRTRQTGSEDEQQRVNK